MIRSFTQLNYYFRTFIYAQMEINNYCTQCIGIVSCIFGPSLGISNSASSSGIFCSCSLYSKTWLWSKSGRWCELRVPPFVEAVVLCIYSCDVSGHCDSRCIHSPCCRYYLGKNIRSTFSNILFSYSGILASLFCVVNQMRQRPLKFSVFVMFPHLWDTRRRNQYDSHNCPKQGLRSFRCQEGGITGFFD